jgi:hypothetical protein
MTSVRKRGASGNDDEEDVAESYAFMSDASLSKSKPIMITKKSDASQILFRQITAVGIFVIIFVLSFIGAWKGKVGCCVTYFRIFIDRK